MGQERLQKILAAAGLASRRAAERLIEEGRVTVNGVVAGLGDSADPDHDRIVVDGRPLPRPERLYVALNKPVGYVTSLRSTHGEATVDQLIHLPDRVFPVGRLDKDTSGLLLLTNDGEWANLVTHPRHEIEKEYRAVVRGIPSMAALSTMEGGVTLPDGTVTSPARVRLTGRTRGSGLLTIILTEGKKRQIRLMAAAAGHPVQELERVRIGPIQLGNLAPGAYRFLPNAEVRGIELAAMGNKSGRR